MLQMGVVVLSYHFYELQNKFDELDKAVTSKAKGGKISREDSINAKLNEEINNKNSMKAKMEEAKEARSVSEKNSSQTETNASGGGDFDDTRIIQILSKAVEILAEISINKNLELASQFSSK